MLKITTKKAKQMIEKTQQNILETKTWFKKNEIKLK